MWVVFKPLQYFCFKGFAAQSHINDIDLQQICLAGIKTEFEDVNRLQLVGLNGQSSYHRFGNGSGGMGERKFYFCESDHVAKSLACGYQAGHQLI